MEISDVFGLPAHPLIVHATVVMVPLAALAVLLHAFVPAARPRLGLVTPGVALFALVLVPLSTSTGESFEEQVGESALVEQHAELADGLLPWVVALLVVAVLLVVRDRLAARPSDAPTSGARRGLDAVLRPVVIGLLAVVAVVGTTQQVVRIGHSGAKATWHGVSASAESEGGE